MADITLDGRPITLPLNGWKQKLNNAGLTVLLEGLQASRVRVTKAVSGSVAKAVSGSVAKAVSGSVAKAVSGFVTKAVSESVANIYK